MGKLLLAVGIDSKAKMVAAKNKIARCELVHCMVEFCNLGKGFVAGRDQYSKDGFFSQIIELNGELSPQDKELVELKNNRNYEEF